MYVISHEIQTFVTLTMIFRKDIVPETTVYMISFACMFLVKHYAKHTHFTLRVYIKQLLGLENPD